MLDILVGEALTAWTLREPNAFAKCLVISLAVCCVECWYGISAFDADWHTEYQSKFIGTK